ncbi:MAG TPA: c-type cytochrome [Woeseiaceae bacterium]|nr:c-type cytochrome [Woeseiaceae bacterium]
MTINISSLTRLAAPLILSLLMAQSALAEDGLEAGKELAYTCLGCHGIAGYRNAYPSYRVPKLGGQKAAYLVIALEGYRDGSRSHPTMIAQASSLTDQEIDDVAAYLASLGGDTVAAGGSDAKAAEKSRPESAQACVACHGPNGVSVNAIWPTIAGQHEDYLLQALKKYRDGTRTDPLMTAQAMLLAEDDLAILARYFANLDGLETTEEK